MLLGASNLLGKLSYFFRSHCRKIAETPIVRLGVLLALLLTGGNCFIYITSSQICFEYQGKYCALETSSSIGTIKIDGAKMFGKSSRHTCDPSDDESPYRSDEALVSSLRFPKSLLTKPRNDLGSARRNDITTTTGTRRERGRAREFDRLEREQRVNEGRDMAVDAGWFSKLLTVPYEIPI